MKIMDKLGIFLLFLVGLLQTCEGEHPFIAGAGGERIRRFEFPWLTLVCTQTYCHCGGTLLNGRFVLTAAHCTYTDTTFRHLLDKSDIIVIVGEHDHSRREGWEDEVGISQYVNHPNFNLGNFDNDLAILKLKRTLRWTIACLPNPSYSYEGLPVVIAGWGATNHIDDTMSRFALKADLKTMSNKDCRTKSSSNSITDNMICANSNDHTSACRGDSGGPLMSKGERRVIGVITKGSRRCDDTTVFARITSNLDWIKKNTDGGGCTI